ncbi:uncharacterized protein LOC107222784 [Neodiprion lecontei]|uniref:Uncharacterized protein LOC107222784 n=1 Tax=Neodiprion lecontei TaxID=441921 RepID=A0A6J0BSK7_NEOLC|nr:uncharacterized protein LOC107222784 [Neodiprion lecontei]
MLGHEFTETTDLRAVTERLLTMVGIWPKSKTNFRFILSLAYMFIHVAMQWAYFVSHMDDLQEVTDMLADAIVCTMVVIKLLVFHKNRILSEMIDAMSEDCENNKTRLSPSEQKIYESCNSKAKTFVKILAYVIGFGVVAWYVRPLPTMAFAGNRNGSTSLLLPFRNYFSFERTEVYMYAFAYVYQVGASCQIFIGFVGTHALLVCLIMHICGELSVLSDKIMNLKKDMENDHDRRIRKIMMRHVRLMWMAKEMDTSFSFVFLTQVLCSSIMIAIAGFNVIMNSESNQKTALATFVFFEASVLVDLYGYCFVGEFLIIESERVSGAVYHCGWYELPPSQARDLILVMARAQKPLHLTVGKFFVFSSANFAEIVKTSMAYLSLLRALARHSLHQFIVSLGPYIMDPATSMNQVGIAKAVQLLDWNNRILTLLGIWPSDPNNLRFTLSFGYMAIQLALEYADLFQSTNTFEHIVANLTQNITFTTIVFQVMLLRLNCRQLKEVIVTVREDFHEENYESCEERKVFLAYYKQSRIFFLTAVPMVLSTAITTYLAPLASVPGMKNRNETVKWNLPYHMRMFHDVSQLHSYALTYAAQLPFVFIASFGHTGPDCLIVTLMLHVCGQLAVLGERIGNMSTDYQECGLAIEKCVRKHVRLIRMAKDLEESYNVILLVQLIGGTVLICILTYNVLANTGRGQKAHFLTFSLYVLSVLLLIYVYCFVGESLIQESTKVHRALTQCAWHEMPLKYEKMIIICMGRAQQPLILTAGKFYIFSMKNFTAILRTSMAYLSVLRSLL